MEHDDDDLLTLLDDEPLPDHFTDDEPWIVMVVDDDASVHDGTRYALADYSYQGLPVRIVSAYSAAEARQLLGELGEVAVILLDVVMETDDAGLQLARYVREDLRNGKTRIILRTGQPGQAPERKVIVDYDLNDYKSKAQLTDAQLFSSLTVALRSYEQVIDLSARHQALQLIIELSGLASDAPTLDRFYLTALTMLGSMLNNGADGVVISLPEEQADEGLLTVEAGCGGYEGLRGLTHTVLADDPLAERLPELVARHDDLVSRSGCFFYLTNRELGRLIFAFPQAIPRHGHDKIAILAFCSKLGVVHDNVRLLGRLNQLNGRLEGLYEQKSNEANALRKTVTTLSNSLTDDVIHHPESFARLLTNSQGMRTIFRYLEAISGSDQPVFFCGEAGSGKADLARIIHLLNKRRGSFISVDLAGKSGHEMLDTLFGHKRGAFSGADRMLNGAVCQASGGTLYINSISKLELPGQVQLLKLLTENIYYPLGSDTAMPANLHLVVGTDDDLEESVKQDRFLSELYYRLTCHQLRLPPLRDRIEDLPLLVGHFLDQAAEAMNKPAPEPPRELFTLLSAYDFPGNLPELRAMIFNAMGQQRQGSILPLHSIREVIELRETKSPVHRVPQETSFHISGNFPTLDELEELMIEEAMKKAGGNQGIAAALLGLSRQALNRRLNRRLPHLKQ